MQNLADLRKEVEGRSQESGDISLEAVVKRPKSTDRSLVEGDRIHTAGIRKQKKGSVSQEARVRKKRQESEGSCEESGKRKLL